MNKHIKENISEMNLTVDENNVKDFLIIDTNLVTESQEIHSQNDCESNSSGDEEEVMHDEVTTINTYKEALIQIKIYIGLLLINKMIIFFNWFHRSNNIQNKK